MKAFAIHSKEELSTLVNLFLTHSQGFYITNKNLVPLRGTACAVEQCPMRLNALTAYTQLDISKGYAKTNSRLRYK